MKDPVIYLDMDGVLADFIDALLWYHNRGDLIEKYEYGIFPTDWNCEGELGDDEAIWAPVLKGREYFWTEINPYDWMNDVLGEVKSCGIPWYICTTPYINPECYSGKLKWLDAYIPGHRTIMMKDKYLLAHDNALLIDDNERNCDRFEAAGGNAFLFPQPWNRRRASMKSRISLLHNCLQEWTAINLTEVI